MNEEGLINGDMTWLCLIQHSAFSIPHSTFFLERLLINPTEKTIRNSIRK
jgi:hypothetical protein